MAWPRCWGSTGTEEKHWSFIRYLRKKFLEEKTVPVVVLACADNDLRLSEFKLLFPTGYHRGACKIAGINYDFMYKAITGSPMRPLRFSGRARSD